jgi:hypothetical protein
MSKSAINFAFSDKQKHVMVWTECAYLRFYFAYTYPGVEHPRARAFDFAVRCQGCRETISAPARTLPDTWIIADCPLCGERRTYLPSDIFQRASVASSHGEARPVRAEA